MRAAVLMASILAVGIWSPVAAYDANVSHARSWLRSQTSGSAFRCAHVLWDIESSWNPRAHNRYSGAYGIPQALPGSKMAAAGADWRWNATTQVRWGLHYVKGRYGGFCSALRFLNVYGWY